MHEEIIDEYEKKTQRILTEKWALGWNDRGHGHGDYGVINKSEDLVIGKIPLELAEHLVELHNSATK